MGDERQSSGLVNHIYELQLLCGGFAFRRLHFDGEKPATGQTADDVGNAARVAGNVRLPLNAVDAGVLVLIAGDAVGAKQCEYGGLNALLNLHTLLS